MTAIVSSQRAVGFIPTVSGFIEQVRQQLSTTQFRMLQLDFLEEGSPDCPLIRIAGDDAIAFSRLRAMANELSNERIDSFEVDGLPEISSPVGTRLTAVQFPWDQGVIRGATNSFEWRLTAGTWDNVAGLLEPFCEHRQHDGFQWLESAGDIRVLVTTNGQW